MRKAATTTPQKHFSLLDKNPYEAHNSLICFLWDNRTNIRKKRRKEPMRYRGRALRSPKHGVMFALVAGLLAACNTETVTPGTSSVVDLQIRGTAQGWTGGTAALRATGTNREDDYLVGYGTLAPDGSFTLKLPELPNVPDSFGPLTCEVGETGELEVTPSTLKVSLVRSFGVTEKRSLDDLELGEVSYMEGNPAGNEDFTLGTYAYASTTGTVKGTCVFVDKTSTHTFDLTLAAGWNHVAVSFTNPTTDFVATYRTAAPPADLSWTYNEFSPPPHEGPPLPGSESGY